MAKSIVKNDEVFVVLGDTICEYDVKAVIDSPHSMLGVRKVDDPREFGVAEIDEDGFIDHVIEKPQIPKSNMALVGLYKIKESEQLFSVWNQISNKVCAVMVNTVLLMRLIV
jgi:glucose-1-phosphate thymidylyltransferase